MAIELSLDTIDELAQDSYADVVIPLTSGKAITLTHPLRMADEQREKFASYFKELEKSEKEGDDAEASAESEIDMIEQMQGLLRIAVAEDADDLFSALGRDATKYQTVIGFYFEKANPGEA